MTALTIVDSDILIDTTYTGLASHRRQPRVLQSLDYTSAGGPYGRNFSRRPSSSL